MEGKRLPFQEARTLKTTVIFLCMQDFTEPSVFLNTPSPIKGRAICSALCSAI